MALDKLSTALLAHLTRDGRMSWQSLGRQVHLTGQAVAVRVHQLVDGGVIRGFTITRGDLRRYFITVFMDTNNFSAFEAFLQTCEVVERASKVAGEGCYELTLACTAEGELDAFTDTLLRFGRYRISTEMRRIKG